MRVIHESDPSLTKEQCLVPREQTVMNTMLITDQSILRCARPLREVLQEGMRRL